jgi:hypothetical protein
VNKPSQNFTSANPLIIPGIQRERNPIGAKTRTKDVQLAARLLPTRPRASNRALKKYLDEEGLPLGFRDLVCLRGAAEAGVFFSFALLEGWSAGEFGAGEVTRLVETRGNPEKTCAENGWSHLRTTDNLLLVGVDGELSQEEMGERPAQDGLGSDAPGALVPLKAVYGGESLLSSPGAGGAWKEEELQAASLTLLDGESEEKLVEAFRHLFRAAPNGAARAAVVASALAAIGPS